MDEKNMPEHIAIIMDGNRRWAKAKGLPIALGHKEGAKTLEKIVRHANKIGLKYITVSDMGDKFVSNKDIKYITQEIETKIKKYIL